MQSEGEEKWRGGLLGKTGGLAPKEELGGGVGPKAAKSRVRCSVGPREAGAESLLGSLQPPSSPSSPGRVPAVPAFSAAASTGRGRPRLRGPPRASPSPVSPDPAAHSTTLVSKAGTRRLSQRGNRGRSKGEMGHYVGGERAGTSCVLGRVLPA